MTRTASLNSDLAECRQYYELVPAHLHFPSSNRKPSDNELWALFAMLVELIDRIERQLASINLDNALEQSSSSATDFFREMVLPRRSLYSKLASELYLIGHPDSQNVAQPDEGEGRRPIEDIFWIGWQFCENSIADGQDALARPENVRDAEALLFSQFFRPDEWMRNAKDINPLMGKNIEVLLNLTVRTRLRELAHSFILSNYLATTALSRSILEYVLIAKAAALGINPSAQDPKHPSRMKRLSVLVDEFKGAKPALATDLEAIVEAGNATLHPRRNEVIALLPLALREKALASIGALRRVIDSLYYP